MESKENINSNRNDLLLQIGKELHQIIEFIYEDEKEINLKENIEYENKEMEKISLKNKKLKSKLNKYKR